MITIKEICTKKEIKTFVNFPFQLYKNNNYWVPPLKKDEVESLVKATTLKQNEVVFKMFLAYKKKTIVGRIAIIINKEEIDHQEKSKTRFGWFDTIDDIAVTKILLDKAIDIGKKEGLEYIEGPVGISNMDKAGMLTEGFDKISTVGTIYNYSYYPQHLKQLGFEIGITWLEQEVIVNYNQLQKLQKVASLIASRYNLHEACPTSKANMLKWATKIFHLMNHTFRKLPSFVPFSEEQITYYKKKYASFLNPKYICLVKDKDENLIGFGLTSPSLSKAFQKSKGVLFPFGFLHIMKALKKNDWADLHLIGIAEEYQKKGVISIIISKIMKTFKEHKIKRVEIGPILETNNDSLDVWTRFGTKVIKKRSTFVKTFAENN